MKKKAKLSLDMIIIIVLAILIILFLLYMIFNNTIQDWIRNLPGYKYNESDDIVEELPEDVEIQRNYYKVGMIINGKDIKFCVNGDCNNLIDSNLIVTGTLQDGYIKIDRFFDKKIGVVSGSRITLNREVIEGYGFYENVKDELPPEEHLLNLDDSVYISGIIYKKNRVIPEKRGIEKGEEIEKSPEDIGNFYNGMIGEYRSTRERTPWYKLRTPIKNPKGELGFDSGGDELVEVQFIKYFDRATLTEHIYVRFRDTDTFNKDETPWIRMDYWNKYRDFKKAPSMYIADL
ncbi:hypothetical protein GF386_03080 [Candidatus Pacearchaeota archaeon]|nr:hypothetical protein [Candidatus Pacearchaeota archaeon]MBD3283123.1 hypothetical protein [Candidatus Pacearchaeota archaeon]